MRLASGKAESRGAAAAAHDPFYLSAGAMTSQKAKNVITLCIRSYPSLDSHCETCE
jgi:hypothetical protein